MADYKDVISGTFNSLLEKAKGFVDSAPVRGAYESGTGKAKSAARIAKLSLEINGQNEELKRVFAEIGKLYYETVGESAEGFFVTLFDKANELRTAIEDKEDEIAALKAEHFKKEEEASDVEVEIFDDVVSDSEEDVQ